MIRGTEGGPGAGTGVASAVAERRSGSRPGAGGVPRVEDRRATDAGSRVEGTAIVLTLAALLVAFVITGVAELVRGGIIPVADPAQSMLVTLGAGFATTSAAFLAMRGRLRAGERRSVGRGGRADAGPPARDRLPRHSPAYDALVRLSSRLTSTGGLDAVLEVVTEEAAAAMHAPVALFLPERSTERLYLAAAHGLPEPVRRVWPAMARDAADRLFGQDQVMVVADVATSELPDREIHAAVGVRSVALVRMDQRGDLIGFLIALSLDDPRSFTADDLSVLRGIADQASQAITNSTLLARTERRLGLTQALRNIDIAIAGSPDVEVTLHVILEEVVRQLHADASSVLLLDEEAQTLTYAAARGFRTNAITRTQLRLGEDRAGHAALERRVVSAADLRRSPPDVTRRWLFDAEEMIAYHALPLVAKGAVKGVLEIFHRSTFEPDTEWREFAEALAGQAAIAIDSATLFAQLQRANDGLLQAYDKTLEGWSRALDLRDRETEGHTQRVTDLTMRLADAMGVDDEAIVHVRRGSILHDIGKMGIPDSILLKPGPLTEDEWLVMRRHPLLAYELLSPIRFLEPALDIPFCHHEKWDGTGYPRGLRGDQIPLAARLFAVADVWDALRSSRPYRSAWPTSDVREYIRSLAGTHFDPRVVDVFERVHAA